ncbi:hypothetical protein BJ912DRAFT_929421 [Pholiota molesta]|nr:hypothetical protein BJ912DRAFT_929421 [Pholiota molesta]
MTEPRLSTVFDYSDLRLHPDGTRVYQKASNRRPVLAKVTVQDARANWIAKDAGGSARIAKYRKRRRRTLLRRTCGQRETSRRGRRGAVRRGRSDTSQRRKKRAAKKPPDQRQFKRRKFEASYEYLEPHEPRAKSTDTAAISEVPAISDTFPTEPSPDLLKSQQEKAPLSRSQSLSSSSDFDDDLSEDEAERRRKLKGKGKARERDSETRGVSADRDQDGGEDETMERATKRHATTRPTKLNQIRKRRKKPGRERILPALYTDMYKVFDGSAMMALGMLVQEHIASLLNPEVPENWIKEVKRGIFGMVTSKTKMRKTGAVRRTRMTKKMMRMRRDKRRRVDEEDELSDEEGDDEWDEGADRGSIPKDDKLEHRNENEHRINPYLPASSRTQTQNNIIHVDSELSTSGERTTGFGLEDDDDPIECTSDESSRSEDTVPNRQANLDAESSELHEILKTPPSIYLDFFIWKLIRQLDTDPWYTSALGWESYASEIRDN